MPPFYEAALATEPVQLARASDELLEQAAALTSRAREDGDWHVVLTANQLNGWLAVDLLRNHRELLPPGIHDPRVAIEADHLLLACRYQRAGISTVLTLDVEAYLSASNELAMRIHKARAGSIPLPLANLLDTISDAAHDLQLQLKWYQEEGDPLALIHLPAAREPGHRRTITAFELRQGEVYLAGHTQREPGYSPAESPPHTASDSSATNDTRQR